jgi:hypothetical protein
MQTAAAGAKGTAGVAATGGEFALSAKSHGSSSWLQQSYCILLPSTAVLC